MKQLFILIMILFRITCDGQVHVLYGTPVDGVQFIQWSVVYPSNWTATATTGQMTAIGIKTLTVVFPSLGAGQKYLGYVDDTTALTRTYNVVNKTLLDSTQYSPCYQWLVDKWDTAYNKILSGVAFSGGNLNFSTGGSSGLTVSLDGRYLQTIAGGDYNSLANKPTIPAAQVQTDWNAVSGMGQLLNKPSLATVATSGSYPDLINKPTLVTSLNGSSGVLSFTTLALYGITDAYTKTLADARYAPIAINGTVTSVGLSTDASWMSVGSSPVTGSGTITYNKTTGLAANQGLFTPNGSTGVVGLRAMVVADLPTGIADANISSAGNWNTAYTSRIQTFTTTGSSGAATWSSGTLNIPNYTAAALGAALTSTAINTTAPLTGGGDLSATRTLAITYSTTPTASAIGAWDVNTNFSADNFINGGTKIITASGTTTLTVDSKMDWYFTGTLPQTLTLPVTSTFPSLYVKYNVVNGGSGILTVNSSGGNLVQSMSPNTKATFQDTTANGTTAADWAVLNYGLITTTSGTVTSVIAGTGLSGGTITSTGTISMPNTGTANTYGSATQVPVLTTDAQGRITGVVNTTITNVTGSSASCTGNAATVTTNANQTGDVTSAGNATTIGALKVATGMVQANAVTLAKMDASTATARKMLLSQASASPIWSTETIDAPGTNTNLMQSDGTNWKSVTIPTWNQNTTGTSSNVINPVSFANGGETGGAATAATTGTMTVNMTTSVITITPSGACTFNAANGGIIGQEVMFAVTTSGVSSFVLTWGTNYKSTATLATGTTTAKMFAVTFRCYATNLWMEISRTTAQ